jgi:NADPH-dependent 7-cyano-7-deazaguanine reductase QueF
LNLIAIPVPITYGNMMIELTCSEITWLCPENKKSDYGTLSILYSPDHFICETISLEDYCQTFRNRFVYNEVLATEIFANFMAVLQPKHCVVTLIQNNEGGGGVSNKTEVASK